MALPTPINIAEAKARFITFEHAEAISKLPLHHSDPFDRLILRVAQVEGFTTSAAIGGSPSTAFLLIDAQS